MTVDVLRAAGLIAVASILIVYGVLRASDGRTLRRCRLVWAGVRAACRGHRSSLIDAYLRGCEDGVAAGRLSALRESQARESDLIARAYALGYNQSSYDALQDGTPVRRPTAPSTVN